MASFTTVSLPLDQHKRITRQALGEFLDEWATPYVVDIRNELEAAAVAGYLETYVSRRLGIAFTYLEQAILPEAVQRDSGNTTFFLGWLIYLYGNDESYKPCEGCKVAGYASTLACRVLRIPVGREAPLQGIPDEIKNEVCN